MMKRSLKKLPFALLVGGLLFSLAACGGSGSDSGQAASATSKNGDSGSSQETEAAKAPLADGKKYTDEYDPEALFRFGMVPAKCDNGQWGYLNENGDWAIEPAYERTYPFSGNGLAFVGIRKRIYGVIDRDGVFVSDIELTEENIGTPFSDTGVKTVRVQGSDGVYQAVLSWKDGELTELPWEDTTGTLGDFTASGYALVRGEAGSGKGKEFGIVDSSLNYTMEYQSRYLVASTIYDPEDHLTVYDTETNAYCVIDMQGNVLYTLDGVTDLPYFAENGLANVDHYGIIDETGKLVRPEEDYFTSGKMSTVPDVELSFHDSDWIAFASGRDSNYKYPTSLTYWNEQGEAALSCIKGRAVKNGLAAVCLEVRAGGDKGKVSVDENGVAWLAGDEDGEAWVVVNANLEVQYFLEEKGIDELESYYYSDGYAIAMVEDREADEEYNYIVDSQGNRLFERDENPELPVETITNSDDQFSGHW